MRSPSILVPITAGVGLVLVWSALHGANVSATVRDLLAGRAPVADEPAGAAVGAAVPLNPLLARARGSRQQAI